MLQKDKEMSKANHNKALGKAVNDKTIDKSGKTGFNFKIIPLMLIVFLIPLFSRYHYYFEAAYDGYPWYNVDFHPIDPFLYSKSILFLVISVLILIELVTSLVISSKEEKKTFLKKMWPLMIYMIFVLLSTAFALDIGLAIKGGYDQQEPFFTLIGYAIIPMYAFLIIKDEKDLRLLGYTGLAAVFIFNIIGFLQIKGYNIYVQNWIKYFTMSRELREATGEISSMPGVYVSLGNSNYVGTYVCEILPLILAMIIIKNKWWVKAIATLDAIGLLIVLYGSESDTGMIILAGMAIVAFIFLVGKWLKKWYISISLIVLFILLIFIGNRITNGAVPKILASMLSLEKQTYDLTCIDTTGNEIKWIYKGEEILFKIYYDDPYVRFKVTENGETVFEKEDVDFNQETIDFKNGDHVWLYLEQTLEGYILIKISDAHNEYMFAYHPSADEYKIVTLVGLEDESISWENAFPGRERMISIRGYIWGITIPRLKEFILIGAGPDNYPVMIMEKGQDYALKYNTGILGTVYTRPHNYYLQMWSNTGLISLIVTLIFVFAYLTNCFKLFFGHTIDNDKKKIGFLCMLSVIGFLGCGIANDSLVSTTPVFWCILGMGIVINKCLNGSNLEN